MRAIVTGVAGFVGSHLAERLLTEGHDVVGVDAFTASYDPAVKWRNVMALQHHGAFELVEADLLHMALGPVLAGADVVFHLAGQPGVRASWGADFADYLSDNVGATQRLLEACRTHPPARFVFASSSSIYGEAEGPGTAEGDRPRPVSPYGVTKLAAEHLVSLYGTTHGLATVALRCFSVYGPRQRPDMGVHRMVRAALTGEAFPLHGDGSASRDFTYVGDVVDAYLAAARHPVAPGTVLNVGAGQATSVADVLALVERLTGRPIDVERRPAAPGDARRTCADTTAVRAGLGWHPATSLADGVERQIAWQRQDLQNSRRSSGAMPRSTS